jgi:hypothetical protein
MAHLAATSPVALACLEMRNIFLARKGGLDYFVLISFTAWQRATGAGYEASFGDKGRLA